MNIRSEIGSLVAYLQGDKLADLAWIADCCGCEVKKLKPRRAAVKLRVLLAEPPVACSEQLNPHPAEEPPEEVKLLIMAATAEDIGQGYHSAITFTPSANFVS